jgi:hypothetical protein
MARTARGIRAQTEHIMVKTNTVLLPCCAIIHSCPLSPQQGDQTGHRHRRESLPAPYAAENSMKELLTRGGTIVMKYNPEIHHRRSIRLKEYDYSREGAYFVTICVDNRECLFGDIMDGEMFINQAGEIVVDSWTWLTQQYDYVELDEWMIMPNRMHGIITIMDGCCTCDTRTALFRGPPYLNHNHTTLQFHWPCNQ